MSNLPIRPSERIKAWLASRKVPKVLRRPIPKSALAALLMRLPDDQGILFSAKPSMFCSCAHGSHIWQRYLQVYIFRLT